MEKLQLLKSYVLVVFFLVHKGKTEINVSAELNCDFTSPCMWRNATDDSGDWIISSHLDIDSSLSIIPMREGDDQPFAYTGGFMGRTQAVLVSDVVNCQLGGANIKYWYYQTGMQSQLDVCIRQPPGSREPSALRCYDGISSTHGHQWIFRVIELPPISQPFEILFRASYYPPSDVIAIDEIIFEAALCACEQSNPESIRKRRSSSASPPLIGYNDWQLLRESEHFKGKTMLIVSQNTMQNNARKEENTITTSTSTYPLTSTSPIPTITSTTVNLFESLFTTTSSSTSTSPPTVSEDTTSEDETTSSTSNVTTSVSPIVPEPSPPKGDPLENFVKLLQQTAPVLPYIPVLVRSLQSSLDTARIDPPIGSIVNGVRTANGVNPIGVPVEASHFYNTGPLAPAQQTPNDNFLMDIAKKFTFMGEENSNSIIKPQSHRTPTLRSSSTMENSFGMIATTLRPIEITPTIYPVKLLRQRKFEDKSARDELIDMSKLNTNDIRKLSEIHNKLFSKSSYSAATTTISPRTSTELIIFQKPTKTESDVANKLTELADILPNGAMNDLSALKDIPDLEGLTRGMDLSLIKKPGGFMALKKQFIERLMRRTMGLPIEDPYISQNTNLPPPIVPFKVTRKMMRDRARRMNMRKRH